MQTEGGGLFWEAGLKLDKKDFDNLLACLKALGQSTESFEEQFKALEKTVGKDKSINNLKQQANALGKMYDDLNKAYKKLGKSDLKDFLGTQLEGLKTDIEGVNAEIAELGEKPVESTKSLREQIRELTMSLAQMKREGKENTQEYQDMLQYAGKLSDAYSDVSQAIRASANDVQTTAALGQGLSTVAAGFSMAAGAAGLFGEKGEEVTKVMMKIQSLMAITQGLQTITTNLQSQSNLMVFIKGIQVDYRKEIEKRAAATTIAAAAEKADADAKTLNVGATKTLTKQEAAETATKTASTAAAKGAASANIKLAAAFKAVGHALKTIPVFGWIVAGLSALTAGIVAFVKHAQKMRDEAGLLAGKELEALKNQLDATARKFETMGEVVKIYDAASSDYISRIKAIMEVEDAYRKSDKYKRMGLLGVREKEFETLSKNVRIYGEGLKNLNNTLNDVSKKEIELKFQTLVNGKPFESVTSLESAIGNTYGKLLGAAKADMQKYNQDAIGTINKIRRLSEEMADASTSKGRKEVLKENIDILNQQLQVYQRGAAIARNFYQSILQQLQAVRDENARLLQQQREREKAELQERRNAAKLNLDLIKNQYKKQRATIKEEYDNQIEDLRKRLQDEKNILSDDQTESIKKQIEALQKKRSNAYRASALEEAKAKREAAQTVEDVTKQIAKRERDYELERREAKIQVMQSGFEKEMAQLEIEHKRKMNAIDDWIDEEVKKRKEEAKQLYLNAAENVGRDQNEVLDEFEKEFDSSAVRSIVEGQAAKKSAEEIAVFAKSTADFMNNYVSSFDTFNSKLRKINDEYTKKIQEQEKAKEDIRLTDEERKLIEESIAKLNEEQLNAIENLKQEYGELAVVTKERQNTEIRIKNLLDKRRKGGLTEEEQAELDVLVQSYKDMSVQIDGINGEWEKLIGLTEEEQLRAEKLSEPVRDIAGIISDINGSAWSGVLSQFQGFFQKAKENIEKQRAEALKGITDPTEIANINAMYDKQQANLSKWLGVIQVVMAGISEMASAFKQLGEAGDDSMKQAGEAIEGVASAASKIIQGAASGGWIGAVVAAVMVIAEETIKIVAMQKKMEAAVKEGMHMKWMEDIDKELAESSTVFGENYRKKLDNAIDVMEQSRDKFKALYKELAEQEISEDEDDMYGDPVGWLAHKMGLNIGDFNPNLLSAAIAAMVPNKVFEKYKEALAKGYDDLEAYMVKRQDRSGFANFLGIQDDYESLKDMIEGLGYEMYDQYGNLNADALRVILDTYEDLGAEDKKWMEDAIDYSDQYMEAMQQLDDYINEVFGNTASTIADQFIDSFLASGQAAMDFGAVITDVSKKMVHDLIQSMILDEVFNDELKDKFRSIMKDGSLDQDQKTMALLSIFNDAQGQLESMTPVIQGVLESYSSFLSDAGQAMQQGNDILGSVTQESVDLLNGQLNAIRNHQLQIQGRLDDVIVNMAGIKTSIDDGFAESVGVLNRIEDNTRGNGYLHSTGTMTVS